MRKSLLFVGLFSLIIAFAACGNRSGKQDNAQDSTKCAMSDSCKAKRAEMAEKWAKFDSLSTDEQEALVAQRAECYAKRLEKVANDTAKCGEQKSCCKDKEKAGCSAEQKAACKDKQAECAAKCSAECMANCAAKKAEIKDLWANFDNLTLVEKKAFFDKVDSMKCCDNGKCCKGEGSEKKCCKAENTEKE